MIVDHPCPGCGHSLVGQQVGSRCPECSLLIVPGGGVMRPRELFVVGIRLIGIWYLAGAGFWIVDIINLLRATRSVSMSQSFEEHGLNILAYAVIGIYCLFGAPHLVALAYGGKSAPETAPPDPGRTDKAP